MADPSLQDDYLERVKSEIRAEADAARSRAPLPRVEPPPRPAPQASSNDGIERQRLDYSIGELTGLDYRAFIDHAFRALLKRNPDDGGAEQQIRLLASGATKAEVLGNLRWSPEGRRIGTRVRGLPLRYALAKLGRVPVVGFFVDWALAFAGLPVLLRHQRAMDTVNAARFNDMLDAQRGNQSRFERAEAAHAGLGAEHDRRSDELRGEIRRLQLRVDDLEYRAESLEVRSATTATDADTLKHEVGQLRHYVHAANHWLSSLQNSLAELEDAAAQERSAGDALVAAVADDADVVALRTQRHREWSAVLASHVAAGARILDLGSGDGSWLEALAACGLTANGIEANSALVARAQRRHAAVALGDPAEALARCADASLDALTLSESLLDDAGASARLLGEAQRALKPGGVLLLRVEAEPHCFAQAAVDPRACAALLAAAGFRTPEVLPAAAGAAVLARRDAS